MPAKKITVQANPTKKFFVEMITRDISLIDCILDLIDNSIDSVLHKTNFDPYRGLFKNDQKILNKYKVTIKFDGNKFEISDNAEGIDRKHAEKHVFTFGSANGLKKELGLSVYGIGMKRAFLKIGRKIDFTTIDSDERTRVLIDVDKWIKQDEWDFEGEYEKRKASDKKGTTIKIEKLNKQIASSLATGAFEKKLLDRVEAVYGVFLKNGLKIEVNKQTAEPKIPTLYQSKNLKPSIETLQKEGVKIKIIAGVTSEDEKNLNGWFIFCNGRMILRGDKTETTGWGGGLRKFHPSTNRFFGFVYFESKDVNKLPWTTTKDGVDFESEIYQYTLGEMVKLAKPVVAFLIAQYRKDKDMVGARELVEKAKEVSVAQLGTNSSVFTANYKASASDAKHQKIEYKVPLKDFKRAQKLLEDDRVTAEDLGKHTFYYFIEHEG